MYDWEVLIKTILYRRKSDYDFKTYLAAFRSLIVTTAFTIYNGVLGFLHSSVWYFCICIYYTLLILLRLSITVLEQIAIRKNIEPEVYRRKIFIFISILLILLNLCLIGPLITLVKQQKPVDMSMIPAIAMAAYTFYKITMSIIHYKKSRRSNNILIRQSRLINLIDAMFSIVVLQSTLIMASTGGDKYTLLPLTATSSGLIWAGIVTLSVWNLYKEIKLYLNK